MIYSIVTMIIKDGMFDAFLQECRKIRPLVLAEEGCLMYDYTVEMQTDSPRQESVMKNRVTLYEKWASMDALDKHSAMRHMDDFVKKVAPMRESVSIRTGVEAF